MARQAKLQIVVEALDKASKQLGKISKNFEKTSEKMRKAGKTMSIGITLPLLAIGAGMIKLASEAEETQGKFDVVFAGMTEEAEQWSKDTARALGRSEVEMKKFSSGLSDILKPLGFATDAAFDMSTEMVELALDVASFNNAQDADVIKAFTAALTGERESLKTYGIVVSEADVKTKAYALGLAEVGEELSKTAKAQATMALLFDNTADAQGDLIRTGASFANQTKALKSAVQDLGVEFGNQFLPLATSVVAKLRELVAWFSDLTDEQKKLIIQIGAVVAAIGPLLIIIGSFTKVINLASIAMRALAVVVTFFAASPIVLIIAAIAALILAGIFLIENWEMVKEKLSIFWEGIQIVFADSIAAIVEGLQKFWEGIQFLFGEGMDFIKGIWMDAWQSIANFFIDIWDDIKGFLGESIDVMVGMINTFVDKMVKAFEKLKQFGRGVKILLQGDAEMARQAALDAAAGFGPQIIEGIQAGTVPLPEGLTIGDINALDGRADGGPVQANRPFMVGEEGPEIFTPSRSGQIIPNGALGGEIKISVFEGATITVSGDTDAKQLARDVATEVAREIELISKGALAAPAI